jgi:hypothetical protein
MRETQKASSLGVDAEMLDNLVEYFATRPLNGQPESFYCSNPYQRPMRSQDLRPGMFSRPLALGELTTPAHLQAQRLLQTIYEQDLVLLPRDKRFDRVAMNDFYADDYRIAGQIIRSMLERYAFNWLNVEIGVTGNWTIESFKAWSENIMSGISTSESALTRFVERSSRPKDAVRFFLIQCAGDFLAEASAMARNVLGNFGTHQSELFKILIDEYGYGVHEKKHSTIFENMMRQAGLDATAHYYWQFYTASSMALTNYFHYISANHQHFFRYLGALYYTEASLAYATQTQSRAIKLAFGDEVDTLYFDEHTHIDVHHGRMAFDKLIAPAVREYGESILPEIVSGFEEFRFLQDVADQDLFAHLAWHERLVPLSAVQTPAPPANAATHSFTERAGELSVTHVHGVSERFTVEDGEISIVASPFVSVPLRAGESIVIPPGHLHGSIVTSGTCRYSVTALD